METAWADLDQDPEVEAGHRMSAYEAGPLLELELAVWCGRGPVHHSGEEDWSHGWLVRNSGEPGLEW